MRASIIQLREVLFYRISVEAGKPLEEVVPGEAMAFDFDGVGFRIQLESASVAPDDEEDPRAFAVTLGITVDNVEGKPAPYNIDVLATGLVEVAEVVEKETRADLARVNGASLVYGAIRELVTNLTSRGIGGPLVLPTMDFRPSQPQSETTAIAAPDGK